MKRLSAILLMMQAVIVTAQSVKERIVHNDPSKYRTLTAVHAGAGQMSFTQLMTRVAQLIPSTQYHNPLYNDFQDG